MKTRCEVEIRSATFGAVTNNLPHESKSTQVMQAWREINAVVAAFLTKLKDIPGTPVVTTQVGTPEQLENGAIMFTETVTVIFRPDEGETVDAPDGRPEAAGAPQGI